jgi:hypothetical protein
VIRHPIILKDVAEIPEFGNDVVGGGTHENRLRD